MKAVEVAITVLTFALGAKSLGGFGDSRGGGKGKGKPQTRVSGPKGNLLGSQDRVTSSSAARRYANRFGRDAAEKRFGRDAVSGLGGKFGRSKATNFARGAATGVAKKLGGRGGVKMLASLGKIGKFLKVPVIGSIISVVLSLMAGDPIQKALFKGVGTAVGGALGGLLATAIGVPPLGLFLGSIVGDYVGDLLYTLFFGGGLKAAGSKFINDIKGIFTGIGDGAKAMFSWVFGGGLLDLLKNVGGGLLKFAGYILNPGGLLWDMLKAGGAVIGAITNFIFGGGLIDLIKNVGGGVLKFIGYILNPGGLLFDALKAGGAAAKMILDFAKSIVGNVVGGAVEGTKRATGGFFDALTFNLFDFDKQNKVETKKKGGGVGRGFQKDTISAQKKSIRKKPSYEKIKVPEGGKIKTGKKTEKAYWDFLGWAGTGGEDETIQLGGGGMMLANRVANVGNSFGDHPYFGPILSLAAKVILGQTPDEQEYKNVGYGLNMLVGDGINKGKINEGVKGYEDGGLVKDAMAGVDISRWATDTFRKELSETLYKNFDKKSSEGSTSGPGTAAGERDSATGELVPGTQTGTAPGATYSRFGTAEQKKMLDAIAFAEGTTGSYGTLYGGRVIDELAAGEMTIAEVLKMQKSKMYKGESVYGSGYDSNATGRYQFMSYVLEEEIGKQGVDPSEKFTPEMQDRLILNRISRMRGVTLELLAAEGMSDKVIDMLAPEFASFPNLIGPDAQGRVGTNTSYYGQGGKSAAEIKQAYGDSTGESSAIELADTQVQPPPLPDEPGNTDTSGSGNISASGSGVVSIGKDLISKGFSVAEHPDFTKTPTSSGGAYTPGKGSVSNVHKGAGHYDGRAIDVTDWRGSLADSKARYRSVLTSLQDNPAINMLIHDSWGGMYAPGQKQGPGAHGHPTHMHIETKRSHAGTKLSNREQMLKILPGQSLLDENTSKSLGATNLARFNAASTPEEMKNIAGQIAGVSDYAPYEQGAQQTVMVQDPPQQQMPESPSSSGGGMMIMSGGSNHDPFEFLDYQG
jgi:muramidase (phage lysozyme)